MLCLAHIRDAVYVVESAPIIGLLSLKNINRLSQTFPTLLGVSERH
jgi:hypothetical protein